MIAHSHIWTRVLRFAMLFLQYELRGSVARNPPQHSLCMLTLAQDGKRCYISYFISSYLLASLSALALPFLLL
jgi:hypothetical protein